jgi:diacylglycerol kinase (CTP)
LPASPLSTTPINRTVCGLICTQSLPRISACSSTTMSSRRNPIPRTPEVISPSPTESAPRDGYFGRTLRSSTRANKANSPTVAKENTDGSSSDPDQRARTRSRSPLLEKKGVLPLTSGSTATTSKATKRKKEAPLSNGATNGHLQPPELSAGHKYWRELSRSPSPSGVIPIHSEFRTFVRLVLSLFVV